MSPTSMLTVVVVPLFVDGRRELRDSFCFVWLQDASQKDRVWCAQADFYLEAQRYHLAAKYFGRTTRSFEEIALTFMRLKYDLVT